MVNETWFAVVGRSTDAQREGHQAGREALELKNVNQRVHGNRLAFDRYLIVR
jgi:hypothetical protein